MLQYIQPAPPSEHSFVEYLHECRIITHTPTMRAILLSYARIYPRKFLQRLFSVRWHTSYAPIRQSAKAAVTRILHPYAHSTVTFERMLHRVICTGMPSLWTAPRSCIHLKSHAFVKVSAMLLALSGDGAACDFRTACLDHMGTVSPELIRCMYADILDLERAACIWECMRTSPNFARDTWVQNPEALNHYLSLTVDVPDHRPTWPFNALPIECIVNVAAWPGMPSYTARVSLCRIDKYRLHVNVNDRAGVVVFYYSGQGSHWYTNLSSPVPAAFIAYTCAEKVREMQHDRDFLGALLWSTGPSNWPRQWMERMSFDNVVQTLIADYLGGTVSAAARLRCVSRVEGVDRRRAKPL